MTNLNRLVVSLTKHGAHKVADLLAEHGTDGALKHTGPGHAINLNEALVKSILCVYSGDSVPRLWNAAIKNGENTLNSLVIASIILSHHELIRLFQNDPYKVGCSGQINRNQFSSEKTFTNLSNNLYETGYSPDRAYEYVKYDFTPMISINGLGILISQLIELKLIHAGWRKGNSLIEEALDNKIHLVFGLTPDAFRNWLTKGSISLQPYDEDLSFFSEEEASGDQAEFSFSPGHKTKQTGTTTVQHSATPVAASLFHNSIQNSLYDELVAQYGSESVGTEIPTGQGTFIDVVLKKDDKYWFYEIKTAKTAKICIRQAIPQLLEYAYWTGEAKAEKLIIVSPNELDEECERYLDFLRDEFGIALHYEQFQK